MKQISKFLGLALIAFLTIGTLTLISCQKESFKQDSNSDNISNGSNNNTSMQSGGFQILSDNEIDSIGIMHNELLDKILTEFDYNSLSPDNTFELVRNSFIQTEYRNTTNEFKEITFDSTYLWIQQELISGNIEQYYLSIKVILESANSLSDASNNLGILKIEVENNTDLTDFEKQTIKVGLSVAIHSAEYWFPIEMGGNGKGAAHLEKFSQYLGNNSGHLVVMSKGKSKAGKVAASDALGACTGGIGFSLGAIFGGPVGVAAYAGALVYGAVSASLLSAAGV